jgi:hypothetical protein
MVCGAFQLLSQMSGGILPMRSMLVCLVCFVVAKIPVILMVVLPLVETMVYVFVFLMQCICLRAFPPVKIIDIAVYIVSPVVFGALERLNP